MTVMNVLTFGGKEKEEKAKKHYESLLSQFQELQEDLSAYIELRQRIATLNNTSPSAQIIEIDDFLNATFSIKNDDDSLSATIGATATGIAATAGTFTLAGTVGTASTGVAISSLSGAAATSSTLATLGGGSLASGGLGMIGGMFTLGGIFGVAAVSGFMTIKSYGKASQYEKTVLALQEHLSRYPSKEKIEKAINEMKEKLK